VPAAGRGGRGHETDRCNWSWHPSFVAIGYETSFEDTQKGAIIAVLSTTPLILHIVSNTRTCG